MCCHPALSPPSQIALTLRAVGGLTTGEIAQAFLVPEATMAQRISRAKARIKSEGIASADPERMPTVLHVLYLIFNEGYTATSGPELARADLTQEAIRLTRTVRALRPGDGEVAGLLALMLLTDARRPRAHRPGRRAGAAGRAGPRAVGPRRDRRGGRPGRAHARARARSGRTRSRPRSPPSTPRRARRRRPTGRRSSPSTSCSTGSRRTRWRGCRTPPRSAWRRGREAGLALIDELEDRARRHHRLAAVRAHLLELAGDRAAARASYRLAARRTSSLPEQRYLTARAERL